MAEKKSEAPLSQPFTDLLRFFHLHYNPPLKPVECFRHAFRVVPFVRGHIQRIMDLSKVK